MRSPFSFMFVASFLAASPAAAQEIVPVNFSLTSIEGSQPVPDTCCQRPVGNDESPAPVAASVAAAPELYVSVGSESRSLFTDQAFTASNRPTAVFDTTLSYQGWSVDVWRRQPLTDHQCDRETDWSLFRHDTLGSVEVEGKLAYIAICGRNAVDARLRLKHALGNGFALTVGGELIRQGFVDNVARAELSYSRDVGHGWTIAPNVIVAYSTFNHGVSVAGELHASHSVARRWTLDVLVKGYTSHRRDLAVGFNLSRTFRFGQ